MPKHLFCKAAKYQKEPVRYPALKVIDLNAEASAIEWQYPNIVLNQMNNSCLRLGVIQGEYPWHDHPGSDELFVVLEGCLFLDLPDGRELRFQPRQTITIPPNT